LNQNRTFKHRQWKLSSSQNRVKTEYEKNNAWNYLHMIYDRRERITTTLSIAKNYIN